MQHGQQLFEQQEVQLLAVQLEPQVELSQQLSQLPLPNSTEHPRPMYGVPQFFWQCHEMFEKSACEMPRMPVRSTDLQERKSGVLDVLIW